MNHEVAENHQDIYVQIRTGLRKIAMELILEYQYTLRVMGVQLDGPVLLIRDNNSIMLNCTIPSSVPKKKHNTCVYHRVCEAIAIGVIKFMHISSEYNYADILTKPLSNISFHHLIKPLLFRDPLNF